MNKKDLGIRFSVISKGVTAINTTNILSKLENNLDRYTPDMVITMMGINDNRLALINENTLNSKIQSFFRSFRIYKLAKLLRLHIISTTEKVFKKSKNKKQKSNIANIHPEKYKQSEEAFKKVIDINPNDNRAYINLGMLY
ncbi:hypothetical protein ACFL0T_08245, partial [Candidatus Omnitrophota bacterium]